MINGNLTKYLDLHSIQYETNVSLKKRTWIHRGGIAELFITPVNAEELEIVVSFLYSQSIRFQLIGHTSNLYILNSCNIPVVVSTSKCRNYSLENGMLYCEAGVGVISLSKQMIKHGINGFEYLTGLPGTIGAAIVNNSSCRDNSIAQLLVSAKVIMNDGSIRTFFPQDFNFKFRMSVFKKHEVDGTIISAILKAEIGDANKLQKIAEDNDKDRAIRLEGHAKNLGCTVNRCFINGNMSLWLRIALFIKWTFS
jgi:UDP-N-acetylmuramate dehydrogenase